MTERTYLKEENVKAEVKKLLTQHGWMWWMPPANGYGKRNVDFNALRAGTFLAIETKFGSNQMTVNQRKFFRDVLDQGGKVYEVNEKNIETFAWWLAKVSA